MKSLPERIMGYAEAKPEATPIQAEDLLHLGDRAAVSRALSRLASSERLLRIYRGLYMRLIETRFGLRAPRREKGARGPVQTLGRDHRAERGRRGQLAWADDAEHGAIGLPHLWTRPPPLFWGSPSRVAARSKLATDGSEPKRRHGHPCGCLAWSQRS